MMFTKQDRKIANQKAMIENRDKFIEKICKTNDTLKANNKFLSEENIAVHEENKDLRYETEEQKDTLREILKLAEGNTYNNDRILINKIKELAKTGIRD